jgi:hypothetical protein
MDNVTLYPELIGYIYWYCDKFQTPGEKLAVKTFRHDRPGMNDSARMGCCKIKLREYDDAMENLNFVKITSLHHSTYFPVHHHPAW